MKNTKDTIRKFNIRPTKSLGQNFLNDRDVVMKIIDSGDIEKNDLIVEIGSGTGTMTEEIAGRAREVIAVEIDKHLIPSLTENLKEVKNVTILNEDILKIDISKMLEIYRSPADSDEKPLIVKVMANLPYYITTPIIMKLLEDKLGINKMVFMVQKEVADRMIAKPGKKDYGALSVAVQYYSKPQKMFDVPPSCFIPQPKVDSTVIVLDVYDTPPYDIKNVKLFFRIIKASFAQRRKTLVNALFNSGYFIETKPEIADILKSKGIEENQRGETLSILQFAEVSNSFSDKNI
ncbi:MAG: 16S rRNA (adenine(1518)-N(6)/adenine(1519)-N(6))-dimethyltransferase RsmA [Clostridia bacterium]|jgi:16S rRNA (adenine1518-N6/adenine1519-N6)-dimethyltransferase